MEKDIKYYASCSFGKDSIGTILLALEHNEPLDGILYVEVMFDNERNISAEIPEHRDFIYNIAIPRLKELIGLDTTVLRSEKDYVFWFNTTCIRGTRIGKKYGFPIRGKCIINSKLKVLLIKQFYKNHPNIYYYVGIAADENRRIPEHSISLLKKYNYTEKMAYELCKKYDLLSPIYKFNKRNGCWFCPNASINQYAYIKMNHPTLWKELKVLSESDNLTTYKFRYDKTFSEIDKLVNLKINKINEYKLF